MKAIQLLLNSQLPSDLRDYTRDLDSKSLGNLMTEVARRYPDQYERISKVISDYGRKASYYQGESLTLNDNRPVIDKDAIFADMDKELAAARKATKNDDEYKAAKLTIWGKVNDRLEKETGKAALAANNNLAYSVMSGARGKPPQLKMMLTTPGLYTDAQDNVVPIFVRNSFGEGLRPAEYLASTYGARKSVLCLHEDTLVRLPDGSAIAIKYMKVGQQVLGSDKEGNTFPVNVLNVYNQGLQPVNKYVFRRGTGEGRHEVTCTAAHAILQNDYRAYTSAYSRFRRGKGNKPDKSLLHKKEVYPVGEKRPRQSAVLAGPSMLGGITEPYALLLGVLTGDGCLTHEDLVIRLSCADEAMIADLSASIRPLGLKISDRRTESNFDWCIVKDGYLAADNASIQKGTQGFVADARMPHKQILINEGLAWCRAEEKKLPKNISKWSNKSVLDYIAGLIATDGSVYFDAKSGMGRVSLAMTAKDVVFGVWDILRYRFGVYPTEISFRDTGGFGDSQSLRKNRLWEFSVTTDSSVKRLLSALPPIPGVKEALRVKALRMQLTQDNPYPKAKLESTTPLGSAQCYDIEVDHEDHLFVLESGIVVSNSTKRATAKGGDFSKQLSQAAASLIITEKDCGSANGIDLDIDDRSLRGRVLARETGGVPAGTVLDKEVLSQLRKKGAKVLIARSSMTCQAKEGLCAHCIGLQANGKFPTKGDAVGITAANSVGEPITQMALNTKHQGGAASSKREYSGFEMINQFAQSPETFPDKSVLASTDGRVTKIIEAPQGGFYVTVNDKPHYVAPGYPITVQVGDTLEAGDELSEGLADPGEVVALRGIGEGRKYYANRFKKLLDDSGMEADRRNTELLARATLDHIQVTDVRDDEDYIPDDVISYSKYASNYVPPVNTKRTGLSKAAGQYLQTPVLHYTLGTKITPKIVKHLSDTGYTDVFTSPDAPTFKPTMVRLRTASHQGGDWLAAMNTSYLKKQLSDAALRGDSTNVESNVHFAPRLAIGANFADNIEQTGKF